MKLIIIHAIFLCLVFDVFSQTDYKVGKISKSVDKKWDLDKYVWSHTHQNFTKTGKKVLDFDAIENWESLVDPNVCLSISPDGNYFAYGVMKNCNNQMDTLVIQSTLNQWRQTFLKANPGFFSADNRLYIFKDEMGLCFFQLETGQKLYVKQVSDYIVPRSKKPEWIAAMLKDENHTVLLKNLLSGKESQIKHVNNYSFERSGQWFCCLLNSSTTRELLIIDLFSGNKFRYTGVDSYLFSSDGKKVLLKTDSGLKRINIYEEIEYVIWSPTSNGLNLTKYSFDGTGKQVLMVFHKDSNKLNENSIWYWCEGMEKAEMKLNNQTPGVNENLRILGDATFSRNNNFIEFLLQDKSDGQISNLDKVNVDVWGYRDKVLQSKQLKNIKKSIPYKAIYNISNGLILCLEKPNEKRISYWGDYAVISKQCCGDRFWERNYSGDSTWVLSLQNGSRRLLPIRTTNNSYFTFSPNGKYLLFFDPNKKCNYFSYELEQGKLVNISNGVPAYQFGYRDALLRTDEMPHDFCGSNAFPGWVDEEKILVYDNYDIWQLDITGRNRPINITNGYGQLHNTLLELSGLGEQLFFKSGDTLLIKAFDKTNKFNGYYRKVLGRMGNPEKLYMGPCHMEPIRSLSILNWEMPPLKPADTNMWIVLRETSVDAPNYYVSSDLKSYKQLTNLVPHKNYNWLTAELHTFKQLDGTRSQGVLYKPENFDPKKKYPVIISFYKELTSHLYQYLAPKYLTIASIFDEPAWMVSHGYLVFIPDIVFLKNKYGPSTVNTIEGAGKYLKSLPYIDHNSLGAAGHSNSGRFGYYLLTHSNSFAAMSIGAGSTDVVSNWLRLDPTTGESWLLWGEKTAYGAALGNLWKNKKSWIDHTAVLQSDKVSSPLLLFHNKKDGVPVVQAEELFISLRRLEKPAWWLQYDDGDHALQLINDSKDYTIRFTQFFDHFLKRSPAPEWMTQGISATRKGNYTGYNLDSIGKCGNACKVCRSRCKKW